jgi:hypothetical protein
MSAILDHGESIYCFNKKEVFVKDSKDKYKTPQGTIALMVIFIVLIIVLWGSAYLTLLARGATG